MGIYHVAGLGTSPGAVTVPLKYHFELFKRQINSNEQDEFFMHSGEMSGKDLQGNLEGLVIITTPQVYHWSFTDEDQKNRYKVIENIVWSTTHKREIKGTEQSFFELVVKEWEKIRNELEKLLSHKKELYLFVLLVDFEEDLFSIYSKVLRMLSYLRGSGRLGKETWINLTGGQNKIQIALQFGASLLKAQARAYYYQVPQKFTQYLYPTSSFNPRKVNQPPDPNYWVDIPILPGQISEIEKDFLRLWNDDPKAIFQLSQIQAELTKYEKDDIKRTARILYNQRYIQIEEGKRYRLTNFGNEALKFILEIPKITQSQKGLRNLVREVAQEGDPWFIEVKY